MRIVNDLFFVCVCVCVCVCVVCWLAVGRLGGDPSATYGHTTYASNGLGAHNPHGVESPLPAPSPGIPANATLLSRTKQQHTTQQVITITK